MMKKMFLLAAFMLFTGLFGEALARDVEPFCSGWEFKKGPFSGDAMQVAARWNAGWQKVDIPHTWNAEDMQKNVSAFYEGVGYYRKRHLFPESMKGKRIFLRFEGVGSCAEVYLNGKELSGARRGYTDVHYIFDNVVLGDGRNVLRAVATWQGKEYVDEMTWEYRGECNRQADFMEHRQEHGSW